MPSENKTPNLGLNSWQGNEYPKRQDFVDDNNKIDEEFGKFSTQMADLDTKVETHKAETASLIKIKKDVVILASGWIDDTANSGFWIYDILDADINTNTMVDVNIDLNDLEKASGIKSVTDSFEGYARLYSDEQLTEDIACDIRLTRQVVLNEG